MNDFIIATDFDGTIVSNKFPEIGEPLKGFTDKLLIEELIDAQKNGAKIILWTCRLGKQLENAIEYCKLKGLVFDAVNDDLDIVKEHFGETYKYWQENKYPEAGKIFANIYIDDRAITNTFNSNLADYLKEVIRCDT